MDVNNDKEALVHDQDTHDRLDAANSSLDNIEASASSIDDKLVDGNDIGDVTVNNAGGNEAVNIQDGGNSITVDQDTHDNLNANANLQVGDVDVSEANPVPVVMDTDINVHVQLTHEDDDPEAGDTHDSIRVGNGDNLMDVNNDKEALVHDQDTHDRLDLANTSLDNIEASTSSIDNKMVDGNDIGDVTVNNGAGNEAVNIQDGGNSITIDADDLDIRPLDKAQDNIEVCQDTHDDLNANANIQVGDIDVSEANPVPVDIGNTDIDIRDLTHDGTSPGYDSTRIGDGTNEAKITDNNELRISDTHDNGGLDAVLNLPAGVAVELKVGVSRKTLRKYVIFEGLDTKIKWGFTNTTQSFDVFKSQLLMVPVGENTQIWFKNTNASGSTSIAIGEIS